MTFPSRKDSYALAVPQFGGFDATAGAQLGFAILSDIEAYFFINAAQGDKRSNVLQAPKVTLFNGQQAFVSDTSQSPFVISVIPVVGDFAAAQQPVIVVLSEGTFMTVQAVVSPRPAIRAADGRAVLQQDRRRQHVPVHRLDDDHDRHHSRRVCNRPPRSDQAVEQQERQQRRPRTRARPCSCRRSPT